MISFVVDASVALKWFLPEPDSDLADVLIRGDTELCAPGLIWFELANAIWKNARLGTVDSEIWGDVAAKLPDILAIHDVEDSLLQSAANIATAEQHPVYDCVYLALAMKIDARVVTVDKRFLGSFANSGFADRVIALEIAARQLGKSHPASR